MIDIARQGIERMRAIYAEPDDARAAQLLDQAIRDIGPRYERFMRYQASLPPEQQDQLAARMQQQPWFRALREFSLSPEYRGFPARAARHPALKAAAARLQQAEYLQIQHHGGPVGSAPAGARPL